MPKKLWHLLKRIHTTIHFAGNYSLISSTKNKQKNNVAIPFPKDHNQNVLLVFWTIQPLSCDVSIKQSFQFDTTMSQGNRTECGYLLWICRWPGNWGFDIELTTDIEFWDRVENTQNPPKGRIAHSGYDALRRRRIQW